MVELKEIQSPIISLLLPQYLRIIQKYGESQDVGSAKTPAGVGLTRGTGMREMRGEELRGALMRGSLRTSSGKGRPFAGYLQHPKEIFASEGVAPVVWRDGCSHYSRHADIPAECVTHSLYKFNQ